MDYMNDLYELCDTISKEIADANEKIRSSGGKLTAGDADYIDKLTHTLKSLKTTIAMEGFDGSYDGSYNGSYNHMHRGYSRRTIPRRHGYSRDGGMVDELREIMNDAPESLRGDIKRLITKAESM